MVMDMCKEKPGSAVWRGLLGHIDQRLRSGHHPRIMDDVARDLQAFSRRGLGDTLMALLQDPQGMAHIAARSYLHGNGFYKLVLFQGVGFSIRLHVWQQGIHAQENIHEHRWPLASAIVTGTLHEERYTDAEDGLSYTEFRYVKVDRRTHAERLGETWLRRVAVHAHPAGSCYSMQPGELHRIVCKGGEPVITLMCQAAAGREWNRLLTTDSAMVPYMARTPLSVPVLQSVLQSLPEGL